MNFNDKIIQCLTTSFPISSPGMAPIDAVYASNPSTIYPSTLSSQSSKSSSSFVADEVSLGVARLLICCVGPSLAVILTGTLKWIINQKDK